MAIVDAAVLAAFMQRDLTEASADVAIEVAESELRSATSIDPWPTTADEAKALPGVWGWLLRLAAVRYDNPAGAASRGAGDTTRSWPATLAREILAAATAKYPPAPPADPNAPPAPIGAFPCPEPVPDPVPRPTTWWPWGWGA